MGIVFNNDNSHYNSNIGEEVKQRYKRESSWPKIISHQRVAKTITHRNAQFLKSLGLQVVVGGKK